MFWRRKTEPRVSVPSQPDRDEARAHLEAELDASLEASASMLRALGRSAFALDDGDVSVVARHFERWAAHVLVRAPVPGEVDDVTPGAPRAWAKLARFVEAHRRHEADWVAKVTRDMRETILAMAAVFSHATLEHGRADVRLRRRLDRLRTSAREGSLDDLRREALSAADAVTVALDEQKVRSECHARELRTRLRALRAQLEDAQRDGETDALTQLSNRRVFDAALERTVLLGSMTDRPASLILVDVDHFKSVNDRFGHPVGDKVLRELADCLTRTFPRRADVVARIGGEEFAVLLSETRLADAVMLGERLRAAVKALRVEVPGAVLEITASVGVGESGTAETSSELLERVDRALYTAKRSGRDRVVSARAHQSGTFDLDLAPPSRAAV